MSWNSNVYKLPNSIQKMISILQNYGNMDLKNHRLSDKLYCKGEVVKVWHNISCSARMDEICY